MRVEAKEAPAPSMELAVISAVTTIVAADFFKAGGSKEILTQLKDEVRKQAASLDISTETGRKAIASLAYKVARSKTALDEQGEKLGEDLRKAKEAIDAERRYVRTELDGLKEEVRKPLTDWENAEKDRVAGHENALKMLSELAALDRPLDLAEIEFKISVLTRQYESRDWQEFAQRAAGAKALGLESLNEGVRRAKEAITERESRERQEAEAREQAIKAREEAAAKEAAERRAEEQAQLAREAAEKERQRVDNERIEAEARAKQAEAQRVREAELAERLLAEAEERRRCEAEAAEARRVADEKAAVEAERKRVAEEARKVAEEAEKRAKNRAHLAAVNREVLAALVALGASDELGKAIISAIAKGDVPHTTINY